MKFRTKIYSILFISWPQIVQTEAEWTRPAAVGWLQFYEKDIGRFLENNQHGGDGKMLPLLRKNCLLDFRGVRPAWLRPPDQQGCQGDGQE